jgi:Flp pilus assembly pilin Flp
MAIAMIAVFKSFRADIATAYKKAGQAIVQGIDDSASGGGSSQ